MLHEIAFHMGAARAAAAFCGSNRLHYSALGLAVVGNLLGSRLECARKGATQMVLRMLVRVTVLSFAGLALFSAGLVLGQQTAPMD